MFSLVLTQANPLFTSRELFQATTLLCVFFPLQLHNIVSEFQVHNDNTSTSLTRSHDQMIVEYATNMSTMFGEL